MGRPRARLASVLVAAAMVALGLVSMRHVSRQSSPVWDEMHFWGLGSYLWSAGRFDVPGVAIHPPLSYYLNSLPLVGSRVPREVFAAQPPGSDPATLLLADVDRGNALLAGLGWRAFLGSRLVFVLVYCLLGVVVFLWSRHLWGDAGGLFSLGLSLLCPNLMAHGYLVTTDLLVATLLFTTCYALWRTLERPALGWLGLFLAAFALAPTAKLTGLMVGPLAAVMVAGWVVTHPAPEIVLPRAGRQATTRLRFLLYWAVVGALAVAALYLALVLVYQGDVRLRMFRLNVELISRYVARGHAIFLDGRVSRHGFPSYYLVALAYKTSLAVLGAIVLAAAVQVPASRRRYLALVGLAAFVLGAASLSRYTLGLRYVLLVFPLLYVAAGRLAVGLFDGSRPEWARRALCAAVILACVAEQAVVYPYPRSYVNRALVRRPAFEALADTDLDWGEGLIALQRFVDSRKLGPVALSYHGSARPQLFGVATTFYENPSLGLLPGPRPRHGLFFVSSTNLSGVYLRNDPYAWLRRQEPLAVVGGTIYLYDLDRAAGAASAPAGEGRHGR
jgi:hypothetical protein